MRPVNLIPEDDRRSHGSASRTGPLAYIVVGGLFALLVGVVMLVLTSNQISEHKGEIASLSARKAAVTARADSLAPYASFQQVAQQRTETIAALADGRFDWERVIRELALILPPHVWLSTLTGSAGGGAGEGTSSESAGSVAGPSLSLAGCARGQDTVAALIVALKEIDGVTRVGLENSALVATAGTAGAGGEAGCTGAQFSILVAFDAAPPSPDAGGAEEAAPAGEESSSSEGDETASSPTSTEATG